LGSEISGMEPRLMADFLLELRCEEIPARMQAGARLELDKLFRRELEAAGVSVGELTIWSTPRRLALIARGLPVATEAVSEEAKGPPEGAPDAAIDGFCKKNGVAREALELRDIKGRMTYFAVIQQPGRAMAEVLAAAIPAIIRDFSWPKSMRWGAASIATESLRWVRPLSGIVALLDGEVVPCEVGGISAGAATMGHRFHHAGEITVGSAADYAEKLRACHVIVDHEERAAIIREGAAKAAAEAGLVLVADEGLVIENAGLTEWPVPLLGRFDAAFLEVPPEVIQLTARVNQKYFVCQGSEGKLANAFVCTANIAAHDPAVVVDGNRKVLAARLSDARFFWEQDQKKTLASHAEGLARITFHEKLGTVADKVERVAKLARWLCEEGIVAGDPDTAEQAARLCKADLVSEMVGEFPELQGFMGGYYARAEGLPDEVADAIRDHYKPVGQGDDVPTAPVTVAVSLADKLDTLFGFFAIDEKPTGSKDPFALRRAAIAVIRLVEANSLRCLISEVARAWSNDGPTGPGLQVEDFMHDRLGVMMRDADVRYDIVQASTNLGTRLDGDIWRVRRRAQALQSFITTEDGANLLAGYKRAANILKKEDWRGIEGEIAQTGEEDPLALVDDPDLAPVIAAKMADRHAAASTLSYSPEPAEKALIDALDAAAPRAAEAVEAERFADAMAALATLRAPIDRFFEEVIVNAPEREKRESRLALLARFRDAVHRVADFSRIEG
jgi:glycyl-tRNA synthetase beta chain